MIPFTEENRVKMMAVAEDLQGTCKSLDTVLQEHFDDDDLTATDFHIDLLYALDNEVMECQACNWWCEAGELNEDQYCGDCAPEDDDE